MRPVLVGTYTNWSGKDKLKVIMTSPEVSKTDLESVGGMIETAASDMGARRILVDSMSHLERLSDDPVELRAIQYAFVNALKREGLTAILTKESTALFGESYCEESIAFVADSYVMMRYVEIESAVHRALLVLKFRGSDHAKDIRRFEITAHGIKVQARFEGQEGIMSGSPRKSMSDVICGRLCAQVDYVHCADSHTLLLDSGRRHHLGSDPDRSLLPDQTCRAVQGHIQTSYLLYVVSDPPASLCFRCRALRLER